MEHELNIKFTNKAMKKLGKMESTKKEKFLTKIKNNVYTVSYTHLTLPTIAAECRSRWSPYH